MTAAGVTVVGGVYRELCMHPRWDEYFGSAGRAACAMATMGVAVELHAYADPDAGQSFGARAALAGIKVSFHPVAQTPGFYYLHGLSTPIIEGRIEHAPLQVERPHVLRFGMLEGGAVVHAQRAVYDPQDARSPQPFGTNGSRAEELALVLNRHEARLLLGIEDLDAVSMARALAERERARIVVIKQGPRGALVLDGDTMTEVPAYQTGRVWKIGSGDHFAAHFAAAWLADGLSAEEAARRASRATAYYCEHFGSFPDTAALEAFAPAAIQTGPRWRGGEQPKVYLAAPFFNLAQLWLVEQARVALKDMGVQVFSPYHDVGRGSAADVVERDLQGIRDSDVVLALADGLDAGTIYEIGYARALGKPVVVYSECESSEDKKMMEGSDCALVDDFVSAIYQTVWAAARA